MSVPAAMFTVTREDGDCAWLEVTIDGFDVDFWTEDAKRAAARVNEQALRHADLVDGEAPDLIVIPDDAPATTPRIFVRAIAGLPDGDGRLDAIKAEVERFVVSMVEARDEEDAAAQQVDTSTDLTGNSYEIGGT